MAERHDSFADSEAVEGNHASQNVSDDTIEHADGSSALASTQDGAFDHSDVENAPILQGTDPLSDDAIEHRSPTGAPVTPQMVILGILLLFFAYFFLSDLVNGSWGKALLGALVLAVCGFALTREVRGKR